MFHVRIIASLKCRQFTVFDTFYLACQGSGVGSIPIGRSIFLADAVSLFLEAPFPRPQLRSLPPRPNFDNFPFDTNAFTA